MFLSLNFKSQGWASSVINKTAGSMSFQLHSSKKSKLLISSFPPVNLVAYCIVCPGLLHPSQTSLVEVGDGNEYC